MEIDLNKKVNKPHWCLIPRSRLAPDYQSISEPPLTGVQNCLSLRNKVGQGALIAAAALITPPSIHFPHIVAWNSRCTSFHFISRWPSTLTDFMDATWRPEP